MTQLTKTQLTDRIRKLEQEREDLTIKLDSMAQRLKSLEMALSNKIEDHKPGQWNYIQRENATRAAEDVLHMLCEWAGRNMGIGETEDEQMASGIGRLLAGVLGMYGTIFYVVAAAGMEDCNWHSEARELYQKYDELSAYERRHSG